LTAIISTGSKPTSKSAIESERRLSTLPSNGEPEGVGVDGKRDPGEMIAHEEGVVRGDQPFVED
jgi:hypothetical protein